MDDERQLLAILLLFCRCLLRQLVDPIQDRCTDADTDEASDSLFFRHRCRMLRRRHVVHSAIRRAMRHRTVQLLDCAENLPRLDLAEEFDFDFAIDDNGNVRHEFADFVEAEIVPRYGQARHRSRRVEEHVNASFDFFFLISKHGKLPPMVIISAGLLI